MKSEPRVHGDADAGWRRIVSEIGIEFMSPWAIDLRDAGQTVEGENVKFDPD